MRADAPLAHCCEDVRPYTTSYSSFYFAPTTNSVQSIAMNFSVCVSVEGYDVYLENYTAKLD